jgi:hypothetical protein
MFRGQGSGVFESTVERAKFGRAAIGVVFGPELFAQFVRVEPDDLPGAATESEFVRFFPDKNQQNVRLQHDEKHKKWPKLATDKRQPATKWQPENKNLVPDLSSGKCDKLGAAF